MFLECGNTLIELTGLIISENDFTDDRLANLARYLSDNGIWSKVEERISGNTIEAYELPEETVRVGCDYCIRLPQNSAEG